MAFICLSLNVLTYFPHWVMMSQWYLQLLAMAMTFIGLMLRTTTDLLVNVSLGTHSRETEEKNMFFRISQCLNFYVMYADELVIEQLNYIKTALMKFQWYVPGNHYVAGKINEISHQLKVWSLWDDEIKS